MRSIDTDRSRYGGQEDYMPVSRRIHGGEKELENLINEPIILFFSTSLLEEVRPALSEYQKQQNERSQAEILLENSESFIIPK